MDDMYLNKMAKYENLCAAWIHKADQEFLDHNCQHTKQECYYLQQAVSLRAEMARISIGGEADYHKRKAKELNTRIAEIVRLIDPDYMKRKEQEARQKKEDAAKGKTGGVSAPSSSAGSKETAVDDEEVRGWFKEIPKTSFEDVVGMEELKEKLRSCIAEEKLDALKAYLKLRKMKSYFFVGPPGCGKTFLIQAFAHELVNKDYKFMSLVGSDILSKYVGDAEKTITRLFEEAEKNAPCIVFIDEIDGICKERSLENLPEYAASITTAFLTGYNRIHSSEKPIIFIGATNYPTRVDNAMLDRVTLINVPFPDKEGRIMKFRRELEAIVPLSEGLSFEELGNLTEMENEDLQYNYRDIERLCEQLKELLVEHALEEYPSQEAAIAALKNGSYGINRTILEEAMEKCRPTPKGAILEELEKWETQFRNRSEG